ncbi:MAG TPA: hypothetical protein VGH99_11715 [Pseudonocardia sp.]|jgi:hypothetical protein
MTSVNVTTEQRAKATAESKALPEKAPEPTRTLVENFPQASVQDRKSREQAAKIVGTSGRNLTTLKRIEQHAPDLIEKRKQQQSNITDKTAKAWVSEFSDQSEFSEPA